ncbi:P-loop containing nucleoside triphosphate hydrolase protein [Globomyces pollinis-pini]|nr:P-loop containing nucleoside triphosphate hydrolase protein [Globomyces pollinis-pini]
MTDSRWALLSLAKKLEKPIEFEGKDKFEKASLRLHVSAVPDVLPCRDDEYTEMFGHIASALEEGSGSCIYVSGVPGTGKTATFRAVLRELRSLLENQELPDFDFVEINGMKLSEPKQAYSSLWNGLTGNKVTPAHAEQLLVSRFNEKQSDRKPCIVLMDELDLLVNKKQTVVYNFFDWPNLPHSKLIVVAVANTMDLPERMLSNKVSSRLGLTRMTFQPYNHAQLMEIIQSRLTGLGIFGSKAIEFCARRISGVSGDARRCLDVCRRAVEIFQNSNDNSDELIGMKHIDSAIKEMNSSPIVKAIQYSSFHQQLFLIACIKQIRKKGTTELDYGSVLEEHEYITRSNHIECPTHSSLHSICTFLAQYQLIMIQTHLIGDPVMKLKLIVNEQDVFLGIRLCKNQMLMKLIERIDR